MKQLLQNLRDGATEVADVPAPIATQGQTLVRTNFTLISTGTERMLVDFGKANPIKKARQQPDKVRMVVDKVRTDGLVPTVEAVRNKLDQPLPLGYCNVGTVTEVGAGLANFSVGDRVVSNGKHAEIVSVPANLCATIPESVSDETASFTVVGAIALQGIRLAQPTLGEVVVVTGLGLVGLMAVQLLRAHGCRVLGIDFDRRKLDLASKFGAETVDLSAGDDPVSAAAAFSRGKGVDAVVLTAATKSSDPVHQAAQMCRKRGRIVLIGVTGLELSRADFYEKELTFQVSCSYGPGRYDSNYEEKGQDYPVGFVRWTAQRNFEAVLDMMADGRLDVMPLISHRFDISEAPAAYEVVAGSEPSLGILLGYPQSSETADGTALTRTVSIKAAPAGTSGQPVVSFIGSGNYATGVLIPAFKSAGANLKSTASRDGVSGLHAGRKHGFNETTTDVDAILADPGTDAVVITTRHDTHARFVLQALDADKHLFVEKPLCLTMDELSEIETLAAVKQDRCLMVGFNRRFAPMIVKAKALLDSVAEPIICQMTVNAGAVPNDHWTQDAAVGGGRIVGEACHFIDLLRFLAGAPVASFDVSGLDRPGGPERMDNAALTLRFENGSLGVITYLANGHRRFPKERLEVFCAGRVLVLDNFRRLSGFGWPGFRGMRLWRQDKGQRACAEAFLNTIRSGGLPPISLDEVIEVSRLSIEAAERLR